ncbi:MAG: hypothetical protein M3Q34_04720 [bacterium]|nr:hypothetical protein [bacterium]
MKKNLIIVIVLIVVAISAAFFILKPESKIASDGHTDHTHEATSEHTPIQDESQPHSHDE